MAMMRIPVGLPSYTDILKRQLGPFRPTEGYWLGNQFIFPQATPTVYAPQIPAASSAPVASTEAQASPPPASGLLGYMPAGDGGAGNAFGDRAPQNDVADGIPAGYGLGIVDYQGVQDIAAQPDIDNKTPAEQNATANKGVGADDPDLALSEYTTPSVPSVKSTPASSGLSAMRDRERARTAVSGLAITGINDLMSLGRQELADYQNAVFSDLAATYSGPQVSPNAFGTQDDTTGAPGASGTDGAAGRDGGLGPGGLAPGHDKESKDYGGGSDASDGPSPGDVGNPDIGRDAEASWRKGGLIRDKKKHKPIRGVFRHAQRFALGGQITGPSDDDYHPTNALFGALTRPSDELFKEATKIGSLNMNKQLTEEEEVQHELDKMPAYHQVMTDIALRSPAIPGVPGVSHNAFSDPMGVGMNDPAPAGVSIGGMQGSTAAFGGNEAGGMGAGGGGGVGAGDNGVGGMGDTRRKGGLTPNDQDGKFEAVPIVAHEGEFVQRPEAVKHYGVAFMKALNERKIPKKAAIGLLSMMKEKSKGRGLLG